MENRPDTETWDNLLTEGTELNKDWKDQLDGIAYYLNILQDAGIPVLWRPYHEMNGVWFWWCNHPGEDGFKRLWISMYNYFTFEKGLNNLIWVWDTNAPRDIPGDEAFDYPLFYPGDTYVDILAADVYRKDYKQSHHDDLLALSGKPIALGEVGEIPDPEILKKQPYWSWFMPWAYHSMKNNSISDYKELYKFPAIITLDEIKRDPSGRISLNTEPN
jgi:mannan endo-1,4-beta-mannosidase